MLMSRTIKVLGEVALFRHLDAPRLQAIALSGDIQTFRAGERLSEKGADGDAAYIVIDGTVDILMPSGTSEIAVANLGPGEIVGEMAVITGEPRSAAIVAKTEVHVLRIERATLRALLREFPELSQEMMLILARRLAEATAMIV